MAEITANGAREGMFLCLAGPAGGGKTTLGERLAALHGDSLQRAVTTTSRAPRPGEVSGVSYDFVTEAEFRERIDRDEFFEWEEVHGNLYGTPRAALEKAKSVGVDLLLIIDIRGAQSFMNSFPDNTVVVFLVAPSRGELRTRLVGRGVGGGELDRRLATAEAEYETLLRGECRVDYFVVNDVIDEAFDTLRSILRAERTRMTRIRPAVLESVCGGEGSDG